MVTACTHLTAQAMAAMVGVAAAAGEARTFLEVAAMPGVEARGVGARGIRVGAMWRGGREVGWLLAVVAAKVAGSGGVGEAGGEEEGKPRWRPSTVAVAVAGRGVGWVERSCSHRRASHYNRTKPHLSLHCLQIARPSSLDSRSRTSASHCRMRCSH